MVGGLNYYADFDGFYLVLILVVMEYGRWADARVTTLKKRKGLNPCCNGIWSVGTNMKLYQDKYVMS